jgi:hypothetical protein
MKLYQMQYIDTMHDGICLSTAFSMVDGEVAFERIMLCSHDVWPILSHEVLDEIENEIYKKMNEKHDFL